MSQTLTNVQSKPYATSMRTVSTMKDPTLASAKTALLEVGKFALVNKIIFLVRGVFIFVVHSENVDDYDVI